MSSEKVSALRTKKNCLLAFRNKKINVFDGAERVISDFSSSGYYFDKVSFIAYDRAEEIVSALKDGRENYENLFIFCPSSMDNTLKPFLTELYSADFNEKGILVSGSDNAFIMHCDAGKGLQLSEIKTVLDAKYGIKFEKSYVKAYGVSPAQLNSVISKAKELSLDIDFGVSESYGDYRIEITYPNSIAKEVYDSVTRTLVAGLKDNIYALDDISLAERLFQLLKLRRLKISVAESFTGGGIGKKLVEIPGISEVYSEGLNTYSNDSKMQRLGVKQFTLDRFGAVSEQTVCEMLDGLRKGGKCDVGIATSGIAGPKSDGTSKPVGLTYIAVSVGDDYSVFKYNLVGDREQITNTAINLALFHTYKLLK